MREIFLTVTSNVTLTARLKVKCPLQKLRHENLVSLLEVFRRKRRFYLVFELMDHTVLDELEERPGGLGNHTTRQHIFQVLRAVDFCHANNVSTSVVLAACGRQGRWLS